MGCLLKIGRADSRGDRDVSFLVGITSALLPFLLFTTRRLDGAFLDREGVLKSERRALCRHLAGSVAEIYVADKACFRNAREWWWSLVVVSVCASWSLQLYVKLMDKATIRSNSWSNWLLVKSGRQVVNVTAAAKNCLFRFVWDFPTIQPQFFVGKFSRNFQKSVPRQCPRSVIRHYFSLQLQQLQQEGAAGSCSSSCWENRDHLLLLIKLVHKLSSWHSLVSSLASLRLSAFDKSKRKHFRGRRVQTTARIVKRAERVGWDRVSERKQLSTTSSICSAANPEEQVVIRTALLSVGLIPQLKMIRKAFVMSVHEGQEAEYERRHRPIWRELEEALKANGVHNYSIFLHPHTRQLFGYVEIESEDRWRAIAETEVCKRWWQYMQASMPSNPDHSPVSVELKEVFHLD